MTRRAAAVGAALAALLLAVSCAGQPPAAGPVEPAVPKASEARTIADRMIARINLHRARQGAGTLRLDPALTRAAQGHARDMAEHDFFDHTGSDGSVIGARATRAGYSWQQVGENIAGGAAEPEAVVDDWMVSEGHRRNMLEPVYVHAGVGHVLHEPDSGGVRYRHYWTLMLGVPGVP